jgi:hypothetical protein
MHLRDPSGELQLQLLRSTPSQSPSEPDLHIEVAARVGKFSVQGLRVWLEWPDVKEFIDELEVLVRDIQGQASLFAMSPKDFELAITPVDSVGHFGAEFTAGSRTYMRDGKALPCSLRGGIELELGQVEEVLYWFKGALDGDADA